MSSFGEDEDGELYLCDQGQRRRVPGSSRQSLAGRPPNRSAAVAAATSAGSRGSASPATSAATWAAVAGPVDMPHGPWPAATNSPLDARDRARERPAVERERAGTGPQAARRRPAIAGT